MIEIWTLNKERLSKNMLNIRIVNEFGQNLIALEDPDGHQDLRRSW